MAIRNRVCVSACALRLTRCCASAEGPCDAAPRAKATSSAVHDSSAGATGLACPAARHAVQIEDCAACCSGTGALALWQSEYRVIQRGALLRAQGYRPTAALRCLLQCSCSTCRAWASCSSSSSSSLGRQRNSISSITSMAVRARQQDPGGQCMALKGLIPVPCECSLDASLHKIGMCC